MPNELIINEGEESWPTIDLAYCRDHYDSVKPNNLFRQRERSSSPFGTSTLESAKEICEVPVDLLSAKGGTNVFQFRSGMKPGKNTQTPVHENPTNNYQVWVNQYFLWYQRLHPKKNTLRQTVIEKAQAHWNSSSDITELMERLIEETPVDLPPLVKQTNISEFFSSTITAVNNLGGSNISNDPPSEGRVATEEDSSPSDSSESMVRPPIPTKRWPNTVQTTSDSLYPPTVDIYDVFRRDPQNLLVWLLGLDSIDDRDVSSLGLKLSTLPLTMYSNVHFNTLLKLWYQCDFPALENRFNNYRQRKIKKRSKLAASVNDETLERAKFKHSVLGAIDIISADNRTGEWIEPFQNSVNRYLPFFREVIRKMKKSVLNSARKVLHGNNPTPKWSILIHNDSLLSWDGVLGDLVRAAEIDDKPDADTSPLLPSQIVELASEVRGCSPTILSKCILDSVAFGVRQNEVLSSLAHNLPIAVVQYNLKYVVFDLHQVDTMEAMLELVFLDTDTCPELEETKGVNIQESQVQVEKEKPTSNSRPASRKPLDLRFPEIPQIVTEFCKQQTHSAHYRRRNSTMQVGTRLQDVRKHLLEKIPELQNWGISEDSVHRFFIPPNKRNNSAKRYLSLVDAQIPHKKNDLRKSNPNAHACFSQHKMVQEMVSDFREDFVAVSCDGKAKIPVGKPAVDRRAHIRKYFLRGHGPNVLDHDFPTGRKHLISIEGIKVLRAVSKKCRDEAELEAAAGGDTGDDDGGKSPFEEEESMSDEEFLSTKTMLHSDLRQLRLGTGHDDATNMNGVYPNLDFDTIQRTTTDRYGRPHVETLQSGPVHLFLRSHKFDVVGARSHFNDMTDVLLKELTAGKKNVVMMTDGGTDYTASVNKNLLFHFRLFKDFKLESLTATQYASYLSAYGNIEHTWGPLNKIMVGVVLNPNLPGEHCPPEEQHKPPKCCKKCGEKCKKTKCKELRKIANSKVAAGEKIVFERACGDLKHLFTGFEIDGHPVYSTVIPSDDPSEQVEKEDEAIVQYFKAKSLAKVEMLDLQGLHKEMCMAQQHMYVKSSHLVNFRACGNIHCELEQCKTPSTHITRALMFMRSMEAPFSPTVDLKLKGHFKTYLDLKNNRSGPPEMDLWDEFVLMKHKGKLKKRPLVARCPFSHIDGENCAGHYSFNSVADLRRHMSLYHPTMTHRGQSFIKLTETCKKTRIPRYQTVRCKQIVTDGYSSPQYCHIFFENYYQLNKHQNATGHQQCGVQRSEIPFKIVPSVQRKKTRVATGKNKKDTKKDTVALFRQENGTVSRHGGSLINTRERVSLDHGQEDGEDPYEFRVESDEVVMEADKAKSRSSGSDCSEIDDIGADGDSDAQAVGIERECMPEKILQEKKKGGVRMYLLQWVGWGDEMTWERAEQFETAEFLYLVNEFKRSCNDCSLDSEPDSSDDISTGTDMEELWISLETPSKEIRLTKAHKLDIENGEGLMALIMDASMSLLAKQTGAFTFESCCRPLFGFDNLPEARNFHAQIHFCGTEYAHWVISIMDSKHKVWTTSSLKNKGITPKVLAEMMNLYVSGRPKTVTPKEINVIPFKQTEKKSCGYLAIAYAVEATLHQTKVSTLSDIQFNEKNIYQWLLGCLENKKFTACEKEKTSKTKSRGKKTKKTYVSVKFNVEGLIDDDDDDDDDTKGSNSTVVGLGDSSTSIPGRDLDTSPCQLGRLTLMQGCLIQLSIEHSEISFLTVGNWVVSRIGVDVWLQSTSWNISRTLRADEKFRVVEPPFLRGGEFLPVGNYRLIRSRRVITVVYPVRDWRYTNVVLSFPDVHNNQVLEVVACHSPESVLAAMRVFSGREVQLYARLPDLFPWKSLIDFQAKYMHGTKKMTPLNSPEQYQELMDVINEQYDVDMKFMCTDHDLKALRELANDLCDVVVATPLPFIQAKSQAQPDQDWLSVDTPNAHANLKSDVPRVPFPLTVEAAVSQHKKYFNQAVTWAAVNSWVTSVTTIPQRCFNVYRTVSPCDVVRTLVLHGKILRQDTGWKLEKGTAKLLKKGATTMVEQISSWFTKERPLVVSAYTFDLQMTFKEKQQSEKQFEVVRVGTWDTEEILVDAFDSMGILKLGGFLAVGGHKIVITAVKSSLGGKPPQKVALSWPRQTGDKTCQNIFNNDIAIHSIINKQSNCPAESWCLLLHGTTQLADRKVAVTELMEATLLGGISQWRINFGTHTHTESYRAR